MRYHGKSAALMVAVFFFFLSLNGVGLSNYRLILSLFLLFVISLLTGNLERHQWNALFQSDMLFVVLVLEGRGQASYFLKGKIRRKKKMSERFHQLVHVNQVKPAASQLKQSILIHTIFLRLERISD